MGVTDSDLGAAQRRRFPALDPEPPPRPWWQRLLLPAGVLVLAGAILAAVEFWPFHPSAAHPAAQSPAARASARLARQATGRILAQIPDGLLILANPDGTHIARQRRLGPVGLNVSASLDGQYLSLISGQLISIRRGPTLAPDSTNLQLSSENGAAWPEPFADHERALVMLLDYGSPGQSSDNPISVVPLATGLPVALGSGDWVAGDPQAAGAFVAVAASIQAPASSNQADPDARLVLRDVGRPEVVLATASALNRDLGQPASQPVILAAFPSPSGAEVAVTVQPAAQPEASGVDTGIVVLSRAGRVLGTVRTALGSAPAWSPSGRMLAYTVLRPNRMELDLWSPGHPATASVFPTGGNYSSCQWSPDGGSVLCATDHAWAIAQASGGPMAVVPAAGAPLAWLTSASRR